MKLNIQKNLVQVQVVVYIKHVGEDVMLLLKFYLMLTWMHK